MTIRLSWKIDTLEKALNVLAARDIDRLAAKKVDYLFNIYPELMKLTHQQIADILGLQRETVTRAVKQ